MTTACSVNGDTDGVLVKHSAKHEIVGKWAAETFCAKHGKTPRLLKVSPVAAEISSLYFRTKTSTFTCIEALAK